MIKISRALALTMIVAALGVASFANAAGPKPKKVTPGKMHSFKPSGKKINLKPATMRHKSK